MKLASGTGICLVLVTFKVVAFTAACTPNARIMESAKTPEPAASAERPQKNAFETDLDAMRTADFQYIFVFRRKDGAELDKDDKKFINAQKPLEVNRVRLSDDGRAVIFGSNFRLPPESLDNLIERYQFEDYSKSELPEPATNSVSNQNQ